MRISVPLWAYLASLTTAYVDLNYTTGSLAASQYAQDPASYPTFENAFEHPDASRTIDFNLYFNYTDQPWVWDISVANVAIPNDEWYGRQHTDNHSVGKRLINTQWRLSFPSAGNQSLNALLEDTGLRLQINKLRIESPAVASTSFNASSGDCSELLGATCVQALVDEISANTGDIDAAKLSGNCSSAIANELSTRYRDSSISLQGYNESQFADLLSSSDGAPQTSTDSVFYSGDPVSFWDSSIYTSSDTIALKLKEAEIALNILILTLVPSTSAPHRALAPPKAVCAVVNPSLVSTAPPRVASVMMAVFVSAAAAAAIML